MVKSSSRSWCRRRTSRSVLRRNVRSHIRRLDRWSIRNLPGFQPGPDDFSRALTAFARAIRAHRRLARLAPEFFDTTEVDRLTHRRKDAAEWMAMWEPALNEAYGPPPPEEPRRSHLHDLPQPPKSPRTRRAVEREFVNWCFWMDAGRLAMARHQHRRPHALLSLTRVARLFQIGFDFAHLACGSYDPKADKSLGHAQALADLERAYGDAAWKRMGEQPSAVSPVPSGPAQHVESPRNQEPPPSPSPLSSPPASKPKADVMAVPLVRGEHGFLTLDWTQARPAG